MSIVNSNGVWVVTDPNGMTVARFVSLYNLLRWLETTNAGGRI